MLNKYRYNTSITTNTWNIWYMGTAGTCSIAVTCGTAGTCGTCSRAGTCGTDGTCGTAAAGACHIPYKQKI